MVPKKFTSYRGQGESGLQRFPGKIFKEKMKIFSGKMQLPQIKSQCGLKLNAMFTCYRMFISVEDRVVMLVQNK